MYVFTPQEIIKSAEINQNFIDVAGITGEIRGYGGTSAPTGWLLCQGQEISRTAYSALYQVIGTLYGVGDGSNTFNLPNAMGNQLAGFNPSDSDFAFGSIAGNKTINVYHKHDTDAHSHTVNNHAHGGVDHTHYTAGTTSQDGSFTYSPNSGTLPNASRQYHTHTFGAWSGGSDRDLTTGGSAPGTDWRQPYIYPALSTAQSVMASRLSINWIIKY